MKTIIIDNKISLIEDYTRLNVTVICPRKNIQKMLNSTAAKFISKKEITLDFHHRAGQVFEVVINVKFSNIEKYLKTSSIWEAENKSQYLEFIEINKIGFSYSYNLMNSYTNKVTGIYAFGNCANYTEPNYCTEYYYSNGKMILLPNTERTNFGKKRYVKNGFKWASNRKF